MLNLGKIPCLKVNYAIILMSMQEGQRRLYYAKNLTHYIGGARIYLKREDLLHGGAHKINNTLGQGLLAKKMGKQRVIAETGAGQHGVATSIACAALNLNAEVYMGLKDTQRQSQNVPQDEAPWRQSP